jgi:aspartate aminotransferase-like enzyme
MPTQSFNPPVRTLMGPGPADVHPRVLAALGTVLADLGYPADTGAALARVQAALAG